MEALEEYIKRTGESKQDALAGLSFFGLQRVLELLEEANRNKKRLVYYYEDDEAMKMDVLSYRFE